MSVLVAAGRDREICRLLQTHAAELEGILDLSRQTIAKRIDEDRLFSVEQVVKVASEKIHDEALRSRTVADIINRFFPELLRYTRDTDVGRFSKFLIFGMHIHAEMAARPAFEDFVRFILSDPAKFVLFVCPPQKEVIQLKRWLKNFQEDKHLDTASFAVLPCKLVELVPLQIIADPWSTPKSIALAQDHLFVDEQNAKRAAQLAGALMDYGLSERACETIDQKEVFTKLLRDLNSSLYEQAGVDENDFMAWINKARAAEPSGK
jgi:hypothetical protein